LQIQIGSDYSELSDRSDVQKNPSVANIKQEEARRRKKVKSFNKMKKFLKTPRKMFKRSQIEWPKRN